MALRTDELENNTFFRTLQTKYAEKFILAQKKNWIICIPCQRSLKGVCISKGLIDGHILKPSPYFKSHYVSIDANASKTFELENEVIKPSDGKGKIKILMEEKWYNEDYQPYRILIIEQPLNIDFKDRKDSVNCDSSNSLGISTSFQQSDCIKVLQPFPELLRLLDKKIDQFCTSYMVLPDYLHDASMKLQSIIEWANEAFPLTCKEHSSLNMHKTMEKAIALEQYILSKVHNKVYPVIKKQFEKEDTIITDKLLSLHDVGLSPDQLGVEEYFCCHTPSAVIELASLNTKNSPMEKLICLVKTLELLNEDIEKSLQENYSPLNPNKGIPCLSSDDLIPLLVNLMVQAKPRNLASNLYYIQNFSWHLSTKDKASFSLVTFQAAKEYLRSDSLNLLKPSLNKLKNEMTLEELIKMTVEKQSSTIVSSSRRTKHSTVSTIDSQLENVTKMIEASTSGLKQWTCTESEKMHNYLKNEENS